MIKGGENYFIKGLCEEIALIGGTKERITPSSLQVSATLQIMIPFGRSHRHLN